MFGDCDARCSDGVWFDGNGAAPHICVGVRHGHGTSIGADVGVGVGV